MAKFVIGESTFSSVLFISDSMKIGDAYIVIHISRYNVSYTYIKI